MSSPAELHCVFLNNNYGKNEVALMNPDGFAVVGVFLQIGNRPNSTFERLVSALSKMRSGDEKTIEPQIDMRTLLPNDMSKYYTYPGSLTTPPCSECVTWILLDQPIVVTENQIDRLRQVHAGCTVCGGTDNFRPICPLGSRHVRSSFPCS
ncbi:hypothetical protein AHF37_01921 [Paragonimus kellicotti]|nr:hypothetical protein AHF37_01921 [Paragonimus kellicotti]